MIWAPAPPRAGGGLRPRHSAGVRFAVIYAVLLALSALAVASFLWWETAGLLDRQTDEAIAIDTDDLIKHWEVGGVPALRRAISDRIDANLDDDDIYLLVDARMNYLAGNLAAWPAAVALNSPQSTFSVQRDGTTMAARSAQFLFPGGLRLLVGRDVQLRSQLRDMLTDALLWALLVVLAMATLGGLVVRSLFRRTIAGVSATAAAIAAGDLTRRVPRSGRGDEFDALADIINDMLDRIGRLMDGVRQVSNAIAHDLRTPITRARARLEDAAAHAASPADLRAAVERATADLDQITAIFQALLRIAEIEAGTRRSAFAAFDLAPLLADVADLYRPAAEDLGLRLTLDHPAGDPPGLPAFGDRQLIQQAVANLLDNAVKFSPAGGVVSLSAGATAAGLHIRVADHGPGIPSAERDRATERFFRGEAARHTQGVGLGLALVQAIAQLHGGTLRLDDHAPGLAATIELPGA